MPSDTETSYISTCERQADVNMEINFGVISPENAYYKIVPLKYYLVLKIGKNNQLNTKLYKNVTLRILTVLEHTKKIYCNLFLIIILLAIHVLYILN